MTQEKHTENNGLYIAIRYVQKSSSLIKNYILNNIPNPIEVKDLHTTIIYSTKWDDVPVNDWELYPAYIERYEIWENDNFYKSNILVAILDSDKIVARHEYLMKNYNLDFGHGEFIPHITLSSNIPKDFDISILPKFSVVGSDEYSVNNLL